MQDNSKTIKLRKQLDTCGYLGTLHPDSTTLVQSIMKDLMKFTAKHSESQRRCRELQSRLKQSQIQNGNDSFQNDKLDYLNQKTFQLQQENKKLKSQINSSQSEQKILMLQGKLTQFQVKYTEEIEDMVRKLQEAAVKIQELGMKVNKLNEENIRLKEKAYKTEGQFEIFSDQLKEVVTRKSRQINELEQNNSKLRIKISTLEAMLEDSKEDIEKLRLDSHNSKINSGQNTNSLSTVSMLKEEIINLERKINLLKNSQIELIQQREKSRKQNKKISEKLIYLESLNLQSQNHESLQLSTKEKFQKMYSQLQEKLQNKQSSLDVAQEKLQQYQKQLQRQSTKIKELMKKNNFLQESLTTVNQEINQISNKLNSKTKELRQAENKRISLERQVQQLQAAQRDNEQQILKHKSELSYKESANPEHVQKIKSTYENQIKLLNKELIIFKENQHQLIVQRQKISIENQKLHRIIEQGSKQIQINQSQKQQLLKENKELKTKLQKGNNQGFDNKNQIVRLEEKVQGLEMFVDELKSANKHMLTQKKILQQEILSQQQQLNQNQLNKKQLFDDNKQLLLQIKSLESRRQDIFTKYKELQQANNQHSTSTVEYKKQYQELKSKYALILKELEQKNIDLITFDQERDAAVNQLDKKCQEVDKLKNTIEKYEFELRDYNRGLTQSEGNINAVNKKLDEYEREIRYLTKQNEQLDRLYNVEAKKIIMDKQMEYKRLQNEFNLVVLGLKQNEREGQRIRQRIKDIEGKKSVQAKQYDEERQKSATLMILNKQIGEQLKIEKQEVKRLCQLIEQLQRQNHIMYETLTTRDREIDSFMQTLNQFELKQTQYMSEINYYEKQLQQLSEELDSRERQIGEITLERDSFKAERNWRRDESINSLSESNWKQLYQNKNQQLKQQYDLKKQQNQQLRHQIRQLEFIIGDLRRKLCIYEKGQMNSNNHAASTRKEFGRFSSNHPREEYSATSAYNTHSDYPKNSEYPPQKSTPIKNIMAESLVESHHDSDNSENINRQNFSMDDRSSLPINSNKIKDKGFLNISNDQSQYGNESEQSSKIMSSKISKTSKSKYDRLLEIEAKYTNTMNG